MNTVARSVDNLYVGNLSMATERALALAALCTVTIEQHNMRFHLASSTVLVHLQRSSTHKGARTLSSESDMTMTSVVASCAMLYGDAVLCNHSPDAMLHRM